MDWDEYVRRRYWADGQHGVPDDPELVVEENPVVGRILGPDGSVVRVVRARAEVSFGFVPTRERTR